MEIKIEVASLKHQHFANQICLLMEEAAQQRGTGIAKRSPEYIASKLAIGHAIIATKGNQLAGFSYIESWSHGNYVANSGLIVHPNYRKSGLAKKIKEGVFTLSKKLYPDAKIFGITTSMAVMKINSDLGYVPVPISALTTDDTFWSGCKGCVNYDILKRTNRQHCLCTGMLYDPQKKPVQSRMAKVRRWNNFRRFLRLKRKRMMRKLRA